VGGWQTPITTLPPTTGSNAALSTLLPKPPTSYANTTTPGVSSSSKLQYAADILGTEGTKTLGAGTSLLGKPLDYWQNLLKAPTRTSLLEQQAPAVSSVIGQYSTGRKAVSQQPRGGGTAATMANLPFQESGAITGLLENQLSQTLNVLQPEAAQAITQIGQTLDQLGLSEMGLNTQGLLGLISAEVAKGGQTAGLLGDLGKGVGQVISAAIMAGAAG
jgi:hypothetical protein